MKDWEVQEKRGCERVRFSESVRFQLKEAQQFVGCTARDISESGICVTLNDFVPLNTQMVLQVQLALERMVDCIARVVWISKLPYSDRYQAGLEFEEAGSLMMTQRKIHQIIQENHK